MRMALPEPEQIPSWSDPFGVVKLNATHRRLGPPAPIPGLIAVIAANVFATFVLGIVFAIANNEGGRFHTGNSQVCAADGRCFDDPLPHIDADQLILGLYLVVGIILVALAVRMRRSILVVAGLELALAITLIVNLGPDLQHQHDRLDQLRACHYDVTHSCPASLHPEP
jgi:hypothetical protein